jgi:hypothetical protein
LRWAFSGTQWRILLWTIRNTYGWHRDSVPFSWYRITKDLGADRGGVVRAGRQLVRAGVLQVQNGRINVRAEPPSRPGSLESDVIGQRPMTNDSAVSRHRKRGQASSLFRRAKERGKEINTNKALRQKEEPQQRREKHHTAGAATPVPGKYDALSES